ncbi:MAG: 16S rRNA (cytosine(967)-C(5))-methyltransferase RsmB [Candidatus Loosdrechtia sp.]|uniref:16S rRNA (cytosine(967)-C(5))-methyltransferase RsmB n=1 Tax=Candidatus Loosdrechtia sp. TaxID=3101272 RepID=UPI003A6BE751|nr:MAG: 16S rRNA (cytosine(967)-C(5))-methyltransferase RsmB [Candidatus Jettenia sp. AMX2]
MKSSSHKADVRYECIRILQEIDEKDVFAQKLIAERCARGDLSGLDKKLLTELTKGCIIHQLALDTLIAFFSKTPLRRIEPPVLYALRLALYQIIYLDKVPIFAAVNTSVELVKKLVHRKHAVKFTNAVLRSAERNIQKKSAQQHEVVDLRKALYRRENTWCIFQHDILPDPSRQPASYIACNYSHPEWLIKRWIHRYGKEKTIEICKINNLPPKLFLRINRKKVSPEEFTELFNKHGIHPQIINDAMQIDNISVVEIPGFAEGLFYVQDISAMKVTHFLKLEKSNTVLDMCAAPGGKATHISEFLNDSGKLYALDSSRKRLLLLKENCSRMGIHNIYCICGNASWGMAPLKSIFDRILIDAPCSNTGVLSRRAEARWRIKEEDIKRLAYLQYSILKTGASLLKDDGKLVYATCSIEPEENQEVIEKFLNNEPGFSLDEEQYYLPGMEGGDGGYRARLRKRLMCH